MLRYYSKYGRTFYAPPTDPSGGGGGSTGNPGANQGGNQPGSGDTPVDPWAGIDLDDLPPETKAKIEKAKTAFATSQTQQVELTRKVQNAEEQARKFQSNHDRLLAQLQQVGNGQQQQQQQDPQAVLTAQVEKILVENGISEAQAKLQAPIHVKILSVQGETLKREIGAGLQPMVGSVLHQQATAAWQQVEAVDKLGALKIQDVAQATWANIEHMLSTNQTVTPEIVMNLRNMNYTAYLEQHGGVPPQQQQQQQNNPPPVQNQTFNMGTRFTYPGAGNMPQQQQQHDPNPAKHVLNEDTRAALAKTFGRMHSTIRPAAFKDGK